MTFKKLSHYFQKLEETSSRLKITEILAELFKETTTKETREIVYLSSGRLLPPYEGLEFQMAEKMMIRALAQATGHSPGEVQKEFKQIGDLGTVAEKLKNKNEKIKNQNYLWDVREKGEMEVLRVYDRLMEIAKEAGEGSVERKIDKMAALIEDLDSLSVRFVVRIPLGRLRLGFSELTILDGLSWMLVKDKSLRKELEGAYNLVADAGEIAERAKKEEGKKREKIIQSLKSIRPKVGTPILPQLAQRLGTVEEMLEKMGTVAIEPKYDGIRLGLHFKKENGKAVVRIFTRNLENSTHMFPEVVEALKTEIKSRSVILDSEGVGIDPKSGKYLPFQQVMRRKRKHEIKKTAKTIPFKAFVFDVLYKDGRSLIDLPLSARRKILEKILPARANVLILSPQVVTKDPGTIRAYHDEQIKKGLEGVMVKKASSFYEAGRRGFAWVKFKQEETKKGGGLADTIEAVVMGVTRGRGKRAEFGVGTFLVGVRKKDKYVTVTSIGTGLTDEQFKELKVQSAKFKVSQKPEEYLVNKNMVPDVWVRPAIVVEVQADNITQSPTHTAGLALRFPRLIRFRDDKRPNQVTTREELEHLYQLQFGQ